MALLLDWRNTGQPDAMLPAVDALRQGGIAVLPTESGYLFAANAESVESTARLSGLVDSGASLSRLVAAHELPRSVDLLPATVKRILSRVWPGPVGLKLSASPADQPLRCRWPCHAAMDGLALSIDFPLLLAEPLHVAGAEETAMGLADAAEAVDIVIDAGPIVGKPVTWIAADPSGWRIEQPGSLSEAELISAAARWIVFICTGNTCRSPMAEALCKTRLSRRLGCRIDELPARGYRVFSAGVAGYAGDAPSPEAVEVLREFDADLAEHRSRPLAIEAVAHADCLVGMTRSHLLAVLTRYPVIGGSLRLLCGPDGDLDDPIGGGVDIYAACARTILRHVDRLITELVRQ
jgi:protein-tyrosine phosphatase